MNWLLRTSARYGARALQQMGLCEGVAFAANRTPTALGRLRNAIALVKSVVDVGASDGRWSAEARPFFGDARFLLIEAQKIHEPALAAFCRRHKWATYVSAAANDKDGTVYFDGADPFGGQASDERSERADELVAARSIDSLVSDHDLRGPYCLKLDTHGHEVPILNGAQALLSRADLVIIEVYNFKVSPHSLLFHEMVALMSQYGFRVVDFSEPLWRRSDRALWQFDLFFLPTRHAVFTSTAHS
jgi:FkbM family methyltransferase